MRTKYNTKNKLNINARRILCFLLSVIVFGGSFSNSRMTMNVSASTLEQQKKDAEAEIKSIKADIKSVKNKISDLKTTKSNLQSYINELDEQSQTLQQQLKDLEDSINAKQEEIDQTQLELEAAQETVNTQYAAMKKRIQYMYESGDVSYLTMFLEAASLADFLNQAEFATQMVDYDRRMLTAFQEAREAVRAAKEKLEEEQKELEALQTEVNEQKEAVELLIQAKTEEIAAYQKKIANAEAQADDFAAQLSEQEKKLANIEKQIAAEAARKAKELEASGAVGPSASGFVWPCPSSRRITSGFGARTSPTAGASSNHKGIDIGAPTGAAIVAACSGVVTTAAYSSSAGNYVVISHGGGLSTVYMHCSSLNVSVGQSVSAGQTIAAVGSTGYSTGPHLHFGVIKNGTYVNPSGYV